MEDYAEMKIEERTHLARMYDGDFGLVDSENVIPEKRVREILNATMATLGHRFNQPLTVILGYAQLLALYGGDQKRLNEDASRIEDASRRISIELKMISDYLSQDPDKIQFREYAGDCNQLDIDFGDGT